MPNSFSTTTASGIQTDFGTRSGAEEKCGGSRNLEIYEFHPEPGLTRESSTAQTQISASIEDDLQEANADMAMAWRVFTDITLGYSENYELRWLNDTAEYGAVCKAWAGRNISRGQTEDVPQQIATALDEWAKRLQMLRDGTALKDYYDDNAPDQDEEAPVGTFQDVLLTFTGDTEEHTEFG